MDKISLISSSSCLNKMLFLLLSLLSFFSLQTKMLATVLRRLRDPDSVVCAHYRKSDYSRSSSLPVPLSDFEKLRRVVTASIKGFSIGADLKGGLAVFSILARRREGRRRKKKKEEKESSSGLQRKRKKKRKRKKNEQ